MTDVRPSLRPLCRAILVLWLGLLPLTGHATVELPPGFSLSLFAKAPGARSLAPAPELGGIFIGTRSDTLYFAQDADFDGEAENVLTLGTDFHIPNGIAWKDGYLYVAEQEKLSRYYFGNRFALPLPKAEVLYSDFPDHPWHGWRYLTFGPDGALYVSIGVPCNICAPTGLEGTILRLDPQNWTATIYAKGIRNSVGLEFHPDSHDLYFTDNGADHMGDDVPADELNRLTQPGQHFGYPYFGGGESPTDLYTTLPADLEIEKPIFEFQAHSAPLGLRYYKQTKFPKLYRNGFFVPQRGSWNRTDPVGYQILFIPIDENGDAGLARPFITGWLTQTNQVLARPVDVDIWTAGRLLISDDKNGHVYLVDYMK